MDQVSAKKLALLAFLLVIMLLMALPPASAPAPTLMKKNNNNGTVGCNNGIMEEGESSCRLIAHDYLDMKFMMGSGISRMLDETSEDYVFLPSLIQIARPCDIGVRGGPYTPCSPSRRKKNPPPETPSPYKRNPPKSPKA
ncbi:hypothetical protein F2P56_011461 [Juglans regia]|uniref:Uncharacterized protein n=1 Tax=Juglans regia TaxID=51240 RepID=A0A833XTG3_JUGRE|nr:hypothetical protein F2P56_011461 [Juglans regia]